MLLLMGPFVDLEHPAVKDGSLDRTFEQVFRDEVRHARSWQNSNLCDWLSFTKIRVESGFVRFAR